MAGSSGQGLGAYEDLVLIHLPIHASWPNQIETYFSIVQRKGARAQRLLEPGGVAVRPHALERHYEQLARPFDRRFTRRHLDDLLARLDRHEPALRPVA